MDRRRFLWAATSAPLGLLGGLSQSCGSPTDTAPSTAALVAPHPTPSPGPAVPVPKVNGGLNVHPLRCLSCAPAEADIVPDLVSLQLAALYELGFDGLRITAPFGDRNTLLAAIPYVRAARALGIDAVVVLADFSGLTLARALFDDERRPAVLRAYARVFGVPPKPVMPGLGGLGPGGVGRIAFQILNEPAAFVGVPPDVYVRELLTPSFIDLKNTDPAIIVVSAAEVGTKAGPLRMRAMLEAGLEQVLVALYRAQVSERAVPLLGVEVKDAADALTGSSARAAAFFVGVPWPPPWRGNDAAVPFLKLAYERERRTSGRAYYADSDHIVLTIALDREMDLVVGWRRTEPNALDLIRGIGTRTTFEAACVYAFGR